MYHIESLTSRTCNTTYMCQRWQALIKFGLSTDRLIISSGPGGGATHLGCMDGRRLFKLRDFRSFEGLESKQQRTGPEQVPSSSWPLVRDICTASPTVSLELERKQARVRSRRTHHKLAKGSSHSLAAL